MQPKQIVTWTRLNLFQVYLKSKWSIQYKTFSFWFLITTHGKKLRLSGMLSSNSKFLTNFLIQLSRLLSIKNVGYFISQITVFYGLQINVKTFKIYKAQSKKLKMLGGSLLVWIFQKGISMNSQKMMEKSLQSEKSQTLCFKDFMNSSIYRTGASIEYYCTCMWQAMVQMNMGCNATFLIKRWEIVFR